MEVSENKVVGVNYVLRDGEGEELERREGDDIFYYLHGHGNIIPGLEDLLSGLEEGAEFEAKFEPEEAYGAYNKNLLQRVPREEFPDDMELKPGTPIQLIPQEGGQGMIFYIKEVAGDQVVLDGNQPLAGKTLQFSGKVAEVRDANDEEIEHGHAHTGHHHH